MSRTSLSRADNDLPVVEVIPTAIGSCHTLLAVRGRASHHVAWLDDRMKRLVSAGIRHVLDARALGGMTVMIETKGLGGARTVADAVTLSADAKGVVLALLDRAGRPITAARLDRATIDALSGEPT